MKKLKKFFLLTFAIFIFLNLIYAAINIIETTEETTDTPYGSYNFSSDEPAGFPTHDLPTSSISLPKINKDEVVNYFPWVNQENTYGAFEDITPSSYDFYFFSSVYPYLNPGQMSSTDTADFIFRHPFDSVNLFGGGYLPYVDFYYSSSICQYLPCPQPPQTEPPEY